MRPVLILALLALPLAAPAAAMPTFSTLLPTVEFPDEPVRLPRARAEVGG
ncbi:hypothetical protein JQC91_07060 [Jannaschia sp. Os4]|nr:hypothetical protein [Jannaschia sp. Os4]MBM2576059.1 hypothetical protein [Jannaschia sp. Os4]